MLKHRLVTGVLVATFFLGAFALGPYWALLLLLLLVYLLAFGEFKTMVVSGGIGLESGGAFLCGLLFLAATALETPLIRSLYPDIPAMPGGVSLVDGILWLTPTLLLALCVLRRDPVRAMERFGASLIAFWYVPVLLSFMLRIGFGWPALNAAGQTDPTGRLVLAYFVWVVKFGDVGAYAVGMRWGQKFGEKLIPEISPAKSVMGLAGAYLGSVCASLAVALAARAFGQGSLGSLPLSWSHAFGIGLLLATTGVMGDLGESLFKRSLGTKDSGSRFPGMGGFLDVIDSLLFSAPFLFLYLRWVWM